MVHRRELADYIDALLTPEVFSDYAPNGLQVEGRDSIQRLVTGVTASARFLQAAIAANADAVLVHHGFFWKGEPAAITGMKAQRIRALIQADVNLLAYHLPLDCHPVYGNNAVIGRQLRVQSPATADVGGVPGLLWHGQLPTPLSASALAALLAQTLDREPLWIDSRAGDIERIAWCSGGGQRFLASAEALGVDAYVSGEISEPTTHEARELGVHYFAAGHHATERGGVQALGEHLAEQFGITHTFIDDPNPA